MYNLFVRDIFLEVEIEERRFIDSSRVLASVLSHGAPESRVTAVPLTGKDTRKCVIPSQFCVLR
jgi:hypothetical protein